MRSFKIPSEPKAEVSSSEIHFSRFHRSFPKREALAMKINFWGKRPGNGENSTKVFRNPSLRKRFSYSIHFFLSVGFTVRRYWMILGYKTFPSICTKHFLATFKGKPAQFPVADCQSIIAHYSISPRKKVAVRIESTVVAKQEDSQRFRSSRL